VVDPHRHVAVRAETIFGDHLSVARQDLKANLHRKRQRPHVQFSPHQQSKSAVESAYDDYLKSISTFSSSDSKE